VFFEHSRRIEANGRAVRVHPTDGREPLAHRLPAAFLIFSFA
jgi:hypothetical protein